MQQWLRSQPDFQDPSSSCSRLPALYADLAAHKAANRASFDASIAWWKRTLFRACLEGAQKLPSSSRAEIAAAKAWTARGDEGSKGKGVDLGSHGDRLALHVDQILLDECTLDEVGRPLGLGTVVTELRTSKDVIRLSDFLAAVGPLQGPAKGSRSIPAALASLAIHPLMWAASQMSISLGLGSHDEDPGERDWKEARGDWVMWGNVQDLANATLKLHRSTPRLSPLECLYSRQSFAKTLASPALAELVDTDASETAPALSDRDIDILLRHLTRDMGAASVSGQTVKLEHEQGQDMRNVGISEHEKGVVNVKETHAQLEQQVDEIEKRIKERQAKIEQCVKEKRKEQALSYLRSKKTLEELLQRRVGSLETLHGVLVKIEQAATDVEIMKSYEMSTATLKTLLGDARLQPDRVDSTMDTMQGTLADADEVRTAIESGQDGMRQAAGVPDLDDKEMEDELAALQKEVELEQAQAHEQKGAKRPEDALRKADTEEASKFPPEPQSKPQEPAQPAASSHGQEQRASAAPQKEAVPAQ